jgi:hypothetical protein
VLEHLARRKPVERADVACRRHCAVRECFSETNGTLRESTYGANGSALVHLSSECLAAAGLIEIGAGHDRGHVTSYFVRTQLAVLQQAACAGSECDTNGSIRWGSLH